MTSADAKAFGPERRSESPSQSTGQLLWLVVAVLVAGTPHLLFVQPWVPVLVVCISVWRIAAAVHRWHLPSIWLRVPLTMLGFTAVLVGYRQISGLNAGSALLLVMVSMKLLETRGHRDRAIVVFICYFLLFAAFLREQAIWSAAYLLSGVLITTGAQIQTSRTGSVVSVPRALTMSASIVLQAVPLMIVLFLLFPRIPGPFWALPQGGGSGVTGLANEMTPGDISELALSDKVAFRVRFDESEPPPAELYWRGPVMVEFDGATWRQAEPEPRWSMAKYADENNPGERFGYEITLEPHSQHWLLALETPATWDVEQAFISRAAQLVSVRPVDQRVAYSATSFLARNRPERMHDTSRRVLTHLPPERNPRALEYARVLRAKSADDAAYLSNILTSFRTDGFVYSLRPPRLNRNSVDEFLFETREGFCGHYASAFTTLARAAGIPARVVTGYQGAELNPLGDYWIVRHSDAHAWVEVFIDGAWRRVDPTAAVAPDRIELGIEQSMDWSAVTGRGLLHDNPFMNQLILSWDALNTGWNRWVLSFGPDSQTTMLSLAGLTDPQAQHLVIGMTVCVTLFLIIIGLINRHRKPTLDRVQKIYQRLCQRTARVTRSRKPTEGPREYATEVGTMRPDLDSEVRYLFNLYVRLRYERQADESLVKKFNDAVRRFRPPRRRGPKPGIEK